MLKKIILIILVISTFSIAVNSVFADDIKGYILPEYYFIGSHHSGDNDNGGIEGQHGFWLRRIYFGYNTKISDKFSARVRLEMNSSAFSESSIVPYIKNAHLKYKMSSSLSIIAGIIEPPSFNKIEKFWGYRFIEKTAPDFFKLASSRDFGIALDGKSKGGLSYTLMYGNYGSNKGEDNTGKAFYGRLGYSNKSMYVEANGHQAADGSKNITYLAGFLGLKGSWGRFGGGYYYKKETPIEGDSKDTGIVSIHGTAKLSKMEVFARYDHFLKEGLKDPSGYLPVSSKGQLARFIIAGLMFKVHKMIKLSPNIKYVFYGDIDNGSKPSGSDLYFNLTAKISFKTGL